MSLYGMMRTGVSRYERPANRLSSVSDNIANSSTTGYKRSSTEFSSLIIPSTKAITPRAPYARPPAIRSASRAT